MGIDMVIFVSGDLSPEQKQRIECRMGSANVVCSGGTDKPPHHYWSESRSENGETVGWEYSNLWRYYGPTYSRGPWPEIYALIRLFLHEFPDREIRYSGDSVEGCDGTICTPEFLEGMWSHWAEKDVQE